jgi:hypothetical protein
MKRGYYTPTFCVRKNRKIGFIFFLPWWEYESSGLAALGQHPVMAAAGIAIQLLTLSNNDGPIDPVVGTGR